MRALPKKRDRPTRTGPNHRTSPAKPARPTPDPAQPTRHEPRTAARPHHRHRTAQPPGPRPTNARQQEATGHSTPPREREEPAPPSRASRRAAVPSAEARKAGAKRSPKGCLACRSYNEKARRRADDPEPRRMRRERCGGAKGRPARPAGPDQRGLHVGDGNAPMPVVAPTRYRASCGLPANCGNVANSRRGDNGGQRDPRNALNVP